MEIVVCILIRVRINVPIKESDESTVDEDSWVPPLWTGIYRFVCCHIILNDLGSLILIQIGTNKVK